MRRVGDLDLDQDLTFEKRQWKVQRVGWAAMVLIVVAALLGVFGSGPLSAASVGDNATLVAHYQRFVRHQGQGELVVKVAPNEAAEGRVEFWLTTEFLGEIDLQGISPEPDEVRSAGDRQIFVFLVDDPTCPLEVSISYFPNGLGRVSGGIGLVDGPDFSFNQLSYP